jgi:hypothetical protein
MNSRAHTFLSFRFIFLLPLGVISTRENTKPMTMYKRKKWHCFERAIKTAQQRVFHESKETSSGGARKISHGGWYLIKSEIETQLKEMFNLMHMPI